MLSLGFSISNISPLFSDIFLLQTQKHLVYFLKINCLLPNSRKKNFSSLFQAIFIHVVYFQSYSLWSWHHNMEMIGHSIDGSINSVDQSVECSNKSTIKLYTLPLFKLIQFSLQRYNYWYYKGKKWCSGTFLSHKKVVFKLVHL